MNDVLKQLVREVEKKLGINQKEIDSSFTVIDVDPIYNWQDHGCAPWCMMFVYAPQGNFLFKGWLVDVESYRERNIPKCLTNIVIFSRIGRLIGRKSRNVWELHIPGTKISISSPSKEGTRFFEFLEFPKTRKPYLKLRKIPKKWIPEFVPK